MMLMIGYKFRLSSYFLNGDLNLEVGFCLQEEPIGQLEAPKKNACPKHHDLISTRSCNFVFFLNEESLLRWMQVLTSSALDQN